LTDLMGFDPGIWRYLTRFDPGQQSRRRRPSGSRQSQGQNDKTFGVSGCNPITWRLSSSGANCPTFSCCWATRGEEFAVWGQHAQPRKLDKTMRYRVFLRAIFDTSNKQLYTRRVPFSDYLKI
jgi:hypothetical protein